MHIWVFLLAFLLSSISVHTLEKLPDKSTLTVIFLLTLFCLFVGLWLRLSTNSNIFLKNKNSSLFLLIAISLIGFSNTAIRAQIRLNDSLHHSNIDLVSRVKLVVTSLPQYKNGVLRFNAQTLESKPDGVPRNIQIKWAEPKWLGPYARYTGVSSLPTVKPGQVWKMALVLRPVTGLYNLGGFDYEQTMFANNIRATATVRGKPKYIFDDPSHSFHILVQRIRYKIKENILPFLKDYSSSSYANMLLALSIGDQSGLTQKQWQVFSRTGITHLVSISGTHVSIISALAAMLAYFIWNNLKFKGKNLSEYLPSQVSSAIFALSVAWLYCLLAGWGIPAQRTFFMLAVVIVIYISNIRISSTNVLLIVAFVITALDPWAVLSNGFWLSFIAVGVLIAIANSNARSINKNSKYLTKKIDQLFYANKLQIIITLALIPVLGVLFNQISVISPVVNAYSISLVSLLITPLSLLIAITANFSFLDIVTAKLVSIDVNLIDFMMQPTQYLSDLGLSVIDIAKIPLGIIALSILGIIYAMLPRGIPNRWMGWLFVLPVFLWQPKKSSHGDWSLYALDVGQAAAVIIKTRNKTVLFDVGNRSSIDSDSAQSVILPFMRYLGIKKIDALIISHADLDHIGGLRSILHNMQVKQIYTSFDVYEWLDQEAKKLKIENNLPKLISAVNYCKKGIYWDLDGVNFKFVWPKKENKLAANANSKKRNEQSCVLSITGKHHSILLTGDINQAEENKIVKNGIKAHDLVLAAHHGSNGSSSNKFIKAISASDLIVQSGSFNRYNHPHPLTLDRWKKQNTNIWRNDTGGMIIVNSTKQKLNINNLRQVKAKYWHTTY